jgi:hypothetical protein
VVNNGYPDNLVSYDRKDVEVAAFALFEAIVARSNASYLRNKFYFDSMPFEDLRKEVATIANKLTRRWAKRYGLDWRDSIVHHVADMRNSGPPEPFNRAQHINYLPFGEEKWREMAFRIMIDGWKYEQLISAICAQH